PTGGRKRESAGVFSPGEVSGGLGRPGKSRRNWRTFVGRGAVTVIRSFTAFYQQVVEPEQTPPKTPPTGALRRIPPVTVRYGGNRADLSKKLKNLSPGGAGGIRN